MTADPNNDMANIPKKRYGMGEINTKISSSGFSMVEVVAVIVIMGILSAVAIASIGNLNSAAEQAGEIAKIKSHLRYSQERSMADFDRNFGIHFNGSTYQCYSFIVLDDSSIPSGSETAVYLPGEENTLVTLTSGLSVSAPELIGFLTTGVPITSPGIGNTANESGSTLSFGSGHSITVTDNTGFIP